MYSPSLRYPNAYRRPYVALSDPPASTARTHTAERLSSSVEVESWRELSWVCLCGRAEEVTVASL
jgi:hypothetical protein